MSYPNPPQFVLAAGEKKVLDFRSRLLDHPVSFVVKATDGTAQVVCEISNSRLANEQPDDSSTIWAPSGAGTITQATGVQEIVRYAPCVAIRFTSTSGGAIIEQKG